MSTTVSEENRIKAEEIKTEANKLFAGKHCIQLSFVFAILTMCIH